MVQGMNAESGVLTVGTESDSPEQPVGVPVSPLRLGSFRNLLFGMTVSALGDHFYFIALPWIVLQLTGSSWILGTVLMATAIPRSMLMLVGGAAVTRFMSPRRMMIVTATARAIFVTAAGMLVWAGKLHTIHLYLLAVLFGIADAFAIPAAQTILPSLVSREQLAPANAWLQGSLRITAFAGPAPAGFIIRIWGAAGAMFVDAASFLIMILSLVAIPDPLPVKQQGPSNMWGAIRQGLTYVAQDSVMRSWMLLLGLLNFCLTGPISIGLATLARTGFGSSAIYGVWMSAFAIGGLAGTAAAGLVRRRRGYVLILIIIVMGLLVCAIAAARQYPVVLAMIMVVMGTGIGLMNTSLITWFQERVEPEFLGRVNGALAFCTMGLLPFSMLLAGALAQANLTILFLGSGVCILVVSTLAGSCSGARCVD
jgi:MFS family permease